jgi:hypothetical protein
MSKLLRRSLPIALVALAVGFMLHNHYVLDTQKLDAAIRAQLPPGASKAQVIHFLQARKPIYCDDEGAHVRARIVGRAGNLIYRKDVILDFEFDTSSRMLSYSEKVYLSFI